MTIGQRIAQLRKEHHFSQEELGAQLGVSRQAIYKWESDASIPEVEKLITLSRIFSVSVGWLLGVEELPDAKTEGGSGELTEQQIKMIEEITSRYIDAQPGPRSVKHKKLLTAAVILLFIGAAAFLISLSVKLNTMENQYQSLQNSISGIQSDVNTSIAGISGRVEEVLKSQNSLTADYGTEYISTDSGAGTVTLSARAIPKTYVEGMEALFWAKDNETGLVTEVQGVRGGQSEFSANIVCPLSDDISISVTFISGDKKESQFLYNYRNLLYDTLPQFRLDGGDLLWTESKDGIVRLSNKRIFLPETPDENEERDKASLKSLKIGVFKNQELVCWAQEETKVEGSGRFRAGVYYKIPEKTVVAMDEDDELVTAAVVTDSYDREIVVCGDSFMVKDGELMWGGLDSRRSCLNDGMHDTWKY